MESRKLILPVCLFLIALLGTAASAQETSYRIGEEDVLEINFWQDKTLNTIVRVGLDGMITLDIIGQIEAAGKTTQELQTDIVRQISRLRSDISQAVVRISMYNYNYVYVSGEVNTPGKVAFEAIPDLWSVINEAGGPTDFADLTRVTIIRGGKDAGKVEVVNVADALATNSLDKLPKLRRQDTIELPANLLGLPSGELARRATEPKNVIYVVGAVTRPGPITFEDNIDVLEAISLAGGPARDADLGKTRVVSKDGLYAQTLQINLDKYTKTGLPARYVLAREDMVVIPEKRGGLFGIDLGTAVTALGVVSSVIFIIDRVNN
jgi:polysaccharide export outer membrane protein